MVSSSRITVVSSVGPVGTASVTQVLSGYDAKAVVLAIRGVNKAP